MTFTCPHCGYSFDEQTRDDEALQRAREVNANQRDQIIALTAQAEQLRADLAEAKNALVVSRWN